MVFERIELDDHSQLNRGLEDIDFLSRLVLAFRISVSTR